MYESEGKEFWDGNYQRRKEMRCGEVYGKGGHNKGNEGNTVGTRHGIGKGEKKEGKKVALK